MLATGLWNPVYDKNLSWVGVRLETDAAIAVTAEFLVGVRESILAIEGFGNKTLFIDGHVLSANNAPLAEFLPPAQLVVVLNDVFLANNTSLMQALAWAKQGARLAVQGMDTPANLAVTAIALRLLNAANARVSYSEKVLQNATRSGARLFAQSIGSMPLFKWCAEQGFSYFTFAGLDYLPNESKVQNPSSLPIMQLLALVAKDANLDEIEEIFKRDPKLAFELLKLVNSAAFGVRKEITSFGQAIMILGQRQLQRWLQLLMYAQHSKSGNTPNIMMQRAAERGRMMELLAQEVGVDTEQAFMVGVFSVLDVLMSTSLKDLLHSIALPQPVEMALLERGGHLGSLLNLLCAMENNAFTTVRRICDELRLEPATLSHAQLDAIFWALKISRTK